MGAHVDESEEVPVSGDGGTEEVRALPSTTGPGDGSDTESEPGVANTAPAHVYSQWVRIEERLLSQLERVREELSSPATESVIKEIRSRAGSATAASLGDVVNAVEQAIRVLKVSESEIRKALADRDEEIHIEGVPNLPASLARFLEERSELPGFSYEVVQDPIRGWIIRWKEYTQWDTIRGFGQFYERPYAWLEE